MSLVGGGDNPDVTWHQHFFPMSHDSQLCEYGTSPLCSSDVTLQFGSSSECLACWAEEKETRCDIALDKEKQQKIEVN